MHQVITLPELVELRAQWRTSHLRVVLTNGTFDLLHIGHVRYLQEARALGDILIVGINSDASVRGYKGPDRPVVPQEERAEIIAALRCVDYTAIFDEPTATHLVAALQPDIYVKGGDYSPGAKPLPEAEAVLSYGGQVHILSFVAGHSASNIIKKVSKDKC